MTQNPQVPWTDEQWARANQVIQEEASRARVAATFLPLYGPLSPDTDFVRKEDLRDTPPPPIKMDDRDIIQLATLQVVMSLRGAQMADPEMKSVLSLFRRAANIIGRLEDAIVFNGQDAVDAGPPGGVGAPPPVWEVHGGWTYPGLLASAANVVAVPPGSDLVAPVSQAIGSLEANGYFGPFAVVLDQEFFVEVQKPAASLALPQDRIISFLGGGPLLRSSALPPNSGVVVALGGSPVELVVAKDVSLQFLQLTHHPRFLFRVYEKIALRIKAEQAIVRLAPGAGAAVPGGGGGGRGRGGRGRGNQPREAGAE
jgi:uncharacterized linocin/CFP29 family protein